MDRRAVQSRCSSSGAFTSDADMSPRYLYPLRLVPSIAVSVLLGRKRAFSVDAVELISALVSEPRVENAHLIPREEPFIVATNHYYRAGYQVWWGIALIAAAIAQARHSSSEIVWLMTNRWTSRLLTPLTYLLFTRLARTYGFVSTPPMPPQPHYTKEAARAVRQVLSLLDSSTKEDKPIIGIAPEGRDSPDGSLIEPSPGTGRFLIHMARRGLCVLPVGVAEIRGVLTASFGPPFVLGAWPESNKKEQDRRASAQVMAAIGAQLPAALWGAFRTQIERVAVLESSGAKPQPNDNSTVALSLSEKPSRQMPGET